MCNSLHEDSQPIPKSGLAWKVFSKINGKLYPWSCHIYNPYIPGKWYRWSRPEEGDGFCFLLTRQQAREFKCRGDVILRIEYRGGLGCHKSDGVTVAICKEFRIIE